MVGTLTLRSSLVELSHEAGLSINDAHAIVERSILRDTLPTPGAEFGDGLLVWSTDVRASAVLSETRIERSARAGIASFGATIGLERMQLLCQPIDLNGEHYGGMDFEFQDAGGNLCGCPEAVATCKAMSAQLEPPPPLP